MTEAGVGARPWFGLGNIQPGDVEPIQDNYGNPNLDVTTATTILLDEDGEFYERGVRFYPPIDYDPGCDIFLGETPPAARRRPTGRSSFPEGGVIPNGATLFPRVVENIEGADIGNLDLDSVVDRPFGDDVPIGGIGRSSVSTATSRSSGTAPADRCRSLPRDGMGPARGRGRSIAPTTRRGRRPSASRPRSAIPKGAIEGGGARCSS